MSSYSKTSGAIVTAIRERHGLSESEAKAAVGQVFDALDTLLQPADARVRVAGFGTFHNKLQAARTGRNVQTGEPLQIAEKNVVKFKPQAKG